MSPAPFFRDSASKLNYFARILRIGGMNEYDANGVVDLGAFELGPGLKKFA